MIRFSLLLICVVLLSGCWDKKELNQVAVILGVGIDKGEDGTYKVTAQVIKPAGGGGGSQQKASGSEVPTWSLAATGDTIMAAINNLNKISPRQLYWAHLQIIIFGEQMAKEGIAPVLTWFERDKDSRAGSYVAVTRGSAENLLNKKIELGNISSKSMADLLRGANLRQITARQQRLRDITKELLMPGVDVVVDVIDPRKIRGKVETYQLTGVAIFKSDKMVGFLKGVSTMGTEIVFDRLKYGMLEGICPNSKGKFTYQVSNFKNKVKPTLVGGKINMNMKIKLEGDLLDQNCPIDLLQPQNKQYVEKQISKDIKQYVQAEFVKSRGLKSDIYGIGREVMRYYPNAWKQMGKSKDYLNRVAFTFKIDSKIRRSGLIMEPTEVKQKEVVE